MNRSLVELPDRPTEQSCFSSRIRLACALALSLLSVAAPSLSAKPAMSRAPENLLCESMTEPLGIGSTLPRFSWQLRDDRRGARQTAYQIRVATSINKLRSDTPDVWDTGRVSSDDSVNVVYAGPPVLSRYRYFWKVRVWDQYGNVSAYSKSSWWEMGLLSSGDWQANWITRDLGIDRGEFDPGASWIWGPEENALHHAKPGRRLFRLRFSLLLQPWKATLLVTAKDHVSVWVNGKALLDSGKSSELNLPRDTWSYSRRVSVGDLLAQGVNTIAVEVTVEPSDEPGEETPAGMIALLRVQTSNGEIGSFASGPDWKTTNDSTDANWFAKGFDDSAWIAAAPIPNASHQTLGTPLPAESPNLFRRQFEVSQPIKTARIYSTALGSYQLYLNGQRVGNDVLAPGWTDYAKHIVYQAYDVTSQLREGTNAIGAILGGGWYADGLSWRQTRYSFGPPPVRLFVQLEVEYADGTRDVIATDESWKTATSPIVFSEIYNGERYDATRELSGWDQPSFADTAWEHAVVESAPPGALVAQEFPPIRITQTLVAKAITNPKTDVYIFDLGQNMAGWARLHVAGPRGTKVRLRFAEILKSDGSLYRDNLRSAEATDTYILRGTGSEVFEPHFTYHGFRYVEVTGFPGVPPPNAVEGVVIHTDSPITITFATDNPSVNQLWNNILWGQRANFMSVPTDCPQRDERLGWMADAQLFWRTAVFNTDLTAFSRKFTTDMRDAQSKAGAFSDVTPRVGPTSDSMPGWADAGVVIPWTAYTQYRDKRILEENWDAMEKWMSHIETANPSYLWIHERGRDFGDWLAIGSETPRDLIATSYWAYDSSLMRQMALALGHKADAKKYQTLLENILTAFNKEYVKTDGTVGNGSQTSYALALHMGLLPETLRAAAANHLVADIQAHNWHLTTGFLGTPYALLALSATGHSDVAYRLLMQTTLPSWLYMVERGATTMWERWNGDQMLDAADMNSFNHYAYGAVAEWLYRYVAGIDFDVDDPGFHRIVLHPQFGSQLRHVKATYDSPYGAITSQWDAAGNKLTWKAIVPPNATALMYFPSGVGTKLSEGGGVLQKSKGLTLLRNQGGTLVYRASAGSYLFSIER